MCLVNKYWKDTKQEWVFEGNTYHTEPIISKGYKCNMEWYYKRHSIEVTLGIGGYNHTFREEYNLVSHQGKLWWADMTYNRYPKFKLIKFKGDFNKYIIKNTFEKKWADIKDCKMIVNSKGEIM